MRNSVTNSVDKYIKACKNSNWIYEEAYKFEFANYINQKVNWSSQSDEEILEILIQSQKIKYTGNVRGVQFVLKSGREKLSEFIGKNDVELFRQIYNGNEPEKINWKNRGMSFTGLSAWLSSLFPEKIYPVPLIGFNNTIQFLFNTQIEKFPKKGSKYLFSCQPYMENTEKILRLYPIEEYCLKEWNNYYEANPKLNIKPKRVLSKVDWVWLVQDFHLFVHREILGLYKKDPKKIEIKEDVEPIAIEGASKLATHMRFERKSGLIKKIKKQALEENKMLNCEVCGFSFLDIYGEIGEGFIEAHHKNPLSEIEGETVTKREDIALVCSNCHRMLHRGNPVYSIKELREKMDKN
jgi:predicted HNH restriction endonuclease